MWGLLGFRAIGMVYSLAVLNEALAFATQPFFKFLTHWGVALAVLYFALALFSHFLPQVRRAAAVLYVTTWTIQFPICMIYWFWIHSRINKFIPVFFNYSAHGGLLVALVLELPLNSVEFRWKDMLYPVSTAALYQVVNIYYTLVDGPVYPGLSYSGMESVMLIGSAVALLLTAYWLGVQATHRKNKTE